MFNKVLIANRGEIAVRVIRACREMGIKTVAIYSDVDKDSLHVQKADEAYCLGEVLSYMHIDKIIQIAKRTRCEAVHPGYGFLAEVPEFAQACEQNGLIFIGPDARVIRLMGNKVHARKAAIEASLPVIPGYNIDYMRLDDIEAIAEEVGFPLLVKAASGGGGKGINKVYAREKLREAIFDAREQAVTYFKDEVVYLEKYLEHTRHIEIQIMADNYGNVVSLGERDCSLQRRNQKLIEESPSPFLGEPLRQKMARSAVNLAWQIGYRGAGTMEFLVEPDGSYYFVEMNTRIQVEHPVTEMTTGIDIVKTQLMVAAGLPLPFTPKDIQPRGWAIECRINAERPDTFFPSPGHISEVTFPQGPWVRVDTFIYPGYDVKPFYDSLIAKLIVWAPSRQEAICRMKAALNEFHIEGIYTNLDFHRFVMDHPLFIHGAITTDCLPRLGYKPLKLSKGSKRIFISPV